MFGTFSGTLKPFYSITKSSKRKHRIPFQFSIFSLHLSGNVRRNMYVSKIYSHTPPIVCRTSKSSRRFSGKACRRQSQWRSRAMKATMGRDGEPGAGHLPLNNFTLCSDFKSCVSRSLFTALLFHLRFFSFSAISSTVVETERL